MIKGLTRQDNKLITILTVLFFMEIVFLSGQLDGFLDANGDLDFEVYNWDVAEIAYTLGFWCVWLLAIACILVTNESKEFKIGAGVFFSLFAFVSGQFLYQAIQLL